MTTPPTFGPISPIDFLSLDIRGGVWYAVVVAGRRAQALKGSLTIEYAGSGGSVGRYVRRKPGSGRPEVEAIVGLELE